MIKTCAVTRATQMQEFDSALSYIAYLLASYEVTSVLHDGNFIS